MRLIDADKLIKDIADKIQEAIDMQETEYAEVHAHWVEKSTGVEICSNCGCGLDLPMKSLGFKRCPWCGAYMDEEENDD